MQRNNFLVGIILLIWFVISFVTNILGPLMPIIIQTYHLSLTMAAFLPFSFFLAYGVMSVPAGMMIEAAGEKRSMLVAFALNFSGALAFALCPHYLMALFSLFIIGIGMAMLQVIINPLMRTAGGEEHFAFFSVLAQLVFGLASFVSPFVFSRLMHDLGDANITNTLVSLLRQLVKYQMNWTALYWLFTFLFALMLAVVFLIKMPIVKLKDDEKTGTLQTYIQLVKRKDVILFFAGIVAYVGTEQATANWMSEFLRVYHHYDPGKEGAAAVAWFWGLMSLGCLLGLVLLKLWDSKLILKIAVLITIVTVSCALFGSSCISFYAFPAIGFFISVMFSIIFSLALNSVSSHHGSFSGILCSGIFGGALIPLLVGAAGDLIGLRYALFILYLTLGYILFIAFYAKPVINNKTINFKDIIAPKESV